MFFCQEMKKGEMREIRDTGEKREKQNKHSIFPEHNFKK
jgi:hypothetical protein